MKYFVDDDHWDVMGYSKELKKLLPRFNKETANFLKNHSFHDGKVVSLTFLNKENGITKDPTTILKDFILYRFRLLGNLIRKIGYIYLKIRK